MKITLCLLLIFRFSCCSEVPQVQFFKLIGTYNYSAYPNDTCKQMQLTSNYVFRLGANNALSVINKSNLLTNAVLLNYTYALAANGLVAVPNVINSFSVDQNESYLTIAQTASTKILRLMNFTMKSMTAIASFYKISFTNLVMTGFIHAIIGNDQLFQVKYSSAATFAASVAITFSILNLTLTNVKNCKCKYSPNNTFIVFWDQYSNVFIYNYTNVSAPTYAGAVVGNAPVSNLTQAVTFSSDETYLIIEADSHLPITIVSLQAQSFLSQQKVAFNGTINKVMFLDSLNNYIIVFNDTAFTIIEVRSLTILYSSSLLLYTDVIEIDYASGNIYVCKNNSV
jgi:hypothetical protein